MDFHLFKFLKSLLYGNIELLSRFAELNFNNTIFGLSTYHYPNRYTYKVGIFEFETGPLVAVVNNYIYTPWRASL